MARASTPKRKEPKDGIVIGTIDGIVWATERMKCDLCARCYRDPRIPGQCIYGGSYREVDGVITGMRRD